MPTISVIVPVYNVEPYIHRCVDSILNQTFTDFELILVDDGSPDNCGKICDEYATKDNRIHVIHQENGGLSAARNAGIDWAFANSDSEWLTFIDSDDWVHPFFLQALYEANINNNTTISSCSFERTTGNEPIIDIDRVCDYTISPEVFFVKKNINSVIACAKLYMKNCFDKIRYPIGKIHEDEFLTYKILFKYDIISIVDAPLYFYFQNEHSIMHSEWTPKKLDALEAFEKQIIFFVSNNFANASYLRKRDYVFSLHKYLSLVDGTKFKKEKKLLKRKLINAIKSYKNSDVITEDEIEWLLSSVMPIRVKLKSYAKKLFSKLTK